MAYKRKTWKEKLEVRQIELLEKEGHIITKKGKKYYVKDFEEKLI